MMRRRVAFIVALAPLVAGLASCSDNSADRNGDGQVDGRERAAEMANDAFIPMQAGRWDTEFTFKDIDVPSLNKAQKAKIMAKVAEGSSSSSCLTEAEAKNPGADFFGGRGADNCVYRKFDIAGQNANMTLSCNMEGMGSVEMTMRGVLGDRQFNFDTDVVMRLPIVGKVKLQGMATGRNVGKCVPE